MDGRRDWSQARAARDERRDAEQSELIERLVEFCEVGNLTYRSRDRYVGRVCTQSDRLKRLRADLRAAEAPRALAS
ncbi:MAG: hypothetical protein AB7N76_01245 [Planctomycetota bacterium]